MKSSRLDGLIAAAAFLAGLLRGLAFPLPTDASFHLARIGRGLLREGFTVYVAPPGGAGAPPLGALVTAFGQVLGSTPLDLGRPSGAILLGLCAAVLAWSGGRLFGRLGGLAAAALLVAPPAFAATFAARPDAALGGLLILVALVGVARDTAPAVPVSVAWLAGLATPVAWPAAAVLQWRARRAGLAAQLAAPFVAGLLLAASLGLPEGSRTEILRGVFGAFVPDGSGWPTTLAAVRSVWVFGVLLALPLVLTGATTAPVRRAVLPWVLAAGAAGLLSGPGEFRESTAAIAPGACFLLAALAFHLPDPGRKGGPSRTLLAAVGIAVALLALQGRETESWRRTVREATARDAQIADFLAARMPGTGVLWAERTGALTTFGNRPVQRMQRDAAARPSLVVFRHGLVPATPVERALFRAPGFLSGYAPFHFRRGPTRGVADAIWTRRPGAPPAESPEGYADLLVQGWRHFATDSLDAAQRAFQEAAGREPPGVGVAHEWLGLALEQAGDARTAETAFQQARQRDPATVRARAHLADRAVSWNRLASADSLIAEALAFGDQEAELWAVRARLLDATGDPAAALQDSDTAVTLNPRNGTILANHGILLWKTGEPASARDYWRLALVWDEGILRYLGDFERAEDDAPAPPLLPLFTYDGFRPARDEP